MSTSNECCNICGDALIMYHTPTLNNCNHTYHYECIMKTFMYCRRTGNKCPLCRTDNGLLPIVNGLPKLIKGIHYTVEYPSEYKSIPCNVLLKSGKRKGCECGNKCIIGSTMCNRHHISSNKKNL